jgi:serpin B
MRKRTVWGAIALMLMAVVVGCSDDESNNPTPLVKPERVQMTRAERQLVASSNAFSFNLFRTAQDEVNSQILSPISITYALGMLNNGAAGDTQAQINKVLGFGEANADSINAFCRKMLTFAPRLDPLTKVMIANNIYVNKGYELKTDFVQKAKEFYDATPETRDFHDGKTMNVINQWASDHTERMIQKVLDANSFNPDAVSYLLNAIYFKGTWTDKFEKSETKDEDFWQAGAEGKRTKMPMMHRRAEYSYAENEKYQALYLPYGNESYAMTILLPKDLTNEVCPVPTIEEWQQLREMMDFYEVDVKLPRFETDTDIDLKDIMSALGMPDAFDADKADFRNFCVTPTYIGLMKQVAKIKLDEQGTEAAAVTVIGMLDAALPPIPGGPFDFHANHPFLYVISEMQTGAIFFIGQYTGN